MRQDALKWLVIVVFWSPVATVHALALSEVQLHSHLNRPLDARVGLSGVEESDLAGLTVRIHPQSGSEERGGVPLRHEILRDGTGWYIRLYTREPVKEPALTFTLEVAWPDGRYSRDYSLLIDPQR